MSDFSFRHLEDDVTADGEFKPKTKTGSGPDAKTIKYPCQTCAGTGKYRGARVHQEKDHCFACGGRGYFMTSERERRMARQRRVERKREKANAAFEANKATGLMEKLAPMCEWNDFAKSLMEQAATREWSAKQIAVAERMIAKVEAKRAEREAKRDTPDGEVDLGRVRELFETARGNGLKFPKLRVGEIILSRAGDNSRNPGAIYVKRDGEYQGKVTPEGQYHAVRSAAEETLSDLKALAKDPLATAAAYGHKTGICACCGRELTNAESVKLGIGPICRGKWGL